MELRDEDLENLMGYLGETGKYQLIQCMYLILPALVAGIHTLSILTVAAIPQHRCFLDGVDSLDPEGASWNASEVLAAIPRDANGQLDSCHLLDASSNSTSPCDKWIYDNTYYHSSRVIEWNLVCGRRWMRALAQTAYMAGVVVGAFILGTLADRIGRKKVLCASAVVQLVLGLSSPFCQDYASFTSVRFFLGIFASAGSFITSFVIIMELVTPTQRTLWGMLFHTSFGVGIMLVAAWGSIISDFFTLEIVYALHAVCLLPLWWLVDESIRWLWSQGRVDEALRIMEKATRINGHPQKFNSEFYLRLMDHAEDKESNPEPPRKYGVLDLFRTPNLRWRTVNVYFNWFTNSLAYYGLSLNTAALVGNPFLLICLVGLVEFPGYIIIVLLVDKVGRRPILISFMLLGGISCIASTYIPSGTDVGNLSQVILVMLGKMLIAGSFAIVYYYTAELFPTVLRNSAVGISSTGARLSAALAPLIFLLDSMDKTLPSVVFGVLVIAAGSSAMLLPETLNQNLPQTLEDGENFGRGDNCCTTLYNKWRSCKDHPSRRGPDKEENGSVVSGIQFSL